VGGFSDAVFDMVASFYKGYDANHWLHEIENIWVAA
jgi:hypothetical protein